MGVVAVSEEVILRVEGLPHQHLLLVSWHRDKTRSHLVLSTWSTAIRLFGMQLLTLSSIALRNHQALSMIWILLALSDQLHLLQILLAIIMGLITGAVLPLL